MPKIRVKKKAYRIRLRKQEPYTGLDDRSVGYAHTDDDQGGLQEGDMTLSHNDIIDGMNTIKTQFPNEVGDFRSNVNPDRTLNNTGTDEDFVPNTKKIKKLSIKTKTAPKYTPPVRIRLRKRNENATGDQREVPHQVSQENSQYASNNEHSSYNQMANGLMNTYGEYMDADIRSNLNPDGTINDTGTDGDFITKPLPPKKIKKLVVKKKAVENVDNQAVDEARRHYLQSRENYPNPNTLPVDEYVHESTYPMNYMEDQISPEKDTLQTIRKVEDGIRENEALVRVGDQSRPNSFSRRMKKIKKFRIKKKMAVDPRVLKLVADEYNNYREGDYSHNQSMNRSNDLLENQGLSSQDFQDAYKQSYTVNNKTNQNLLEKFPTYDQTSEEAHHSIDRNLQQLKNKR